MNHYVEAMSLHQLGKAERAREAMAEASRLLDEKAPRLDSIDGSWNALAVLSDSPPRGRGTDRVREGAQAMTETHSLNQTMHLHSTPPLR